MSYTFTTRDGPPSLMSISASTPIGYSHSGNPEGRWLLTIGWMRIIRFRDGWRPESLIFSMRELASNKSKCIISTTTASMIGGSTPTTLMILISLAQGARLMASANQGQKRRRRHWRSHNSQKVQDIVTVEILQLKVKNMVEELNREDYMIHST